MATVRLFAAAREAAGVGRDRIDAASVEELLAEARARYGPAFAAVLDTCRIWVNGDAAELDTKLLDGDEVALLPPVSGGAGEGRPWT